MRALKISAVSAALTALLSAGFFLMPEKALARSVAERCDWRGCYYITCNYTGDRCHRYSEYEWRWRREHDCYDGDGCYRDGSYRDAYDRDGYRRHHRHHDCGYREGCYR